MPPSNIPCEANTDEYLRFAESFFAMAERECVRMKERIEKEGASAAVHQMPALISLVNCVGYLRGQDGMLYEAPRSGILGPLYKMEDTVEKHLDEIIQSILAADQVKEVYKERLMNYFVRSRCGEKPTILW